MSLTDIQSAASAAVIVLIIIQVCKRWIDEKLVPLASILLGIVIVVAATLVLGQSSPEAIGNAVLQGILAGAASSGLYSVQKPVGLLPSK